MRPAILSLRPAIDHALSRIHVVCDSHHCRSRQILRSFPGGRRGVRVGARWYCGVDCFVEAAGTTLFALANQRVIEIPRSPRLTLGLVMLSKGYLTTEQLRVASDQSQWRGEDIDATLIRLGMATEKQIAMARSVQWGYPVLAQEHIGHMVQADIPQSILHSCSAIPLHYSHAAKRILLGFVYRIEHGLLRSIEQITGCRVEPCFITASDLAEQSERLTKIPNYSETFIEDPGPPERMARALGRTAVVIRAGEARFTQCKGNIWVRMTGKNGVADVVFRPETAAVGPEEPQSDFSGELISSFG